MVSDETGIEDSGLIVEIEPLDASEVVTHDADVLPKVSTGEHGVLLCDVTQADVVDSRRAVSHLVCIGLVNAAGKSETCQCCKAHEHE